MFSLFHPDTDALLHEVRQLVFGLGFPSAAIEGGANLDHACGQQIVSFSTVCANFQCDRGVWEKKISADSERTQTSPNQSRQF